MSKKVYITYYIVILKVCKVENRTKGKVGNSYLEKLIKHCRFVRRKFSLFFQKQIFLAKINWCY